MANRKSHIEKDIKREKWFTFHSSDLDVKIDKKDKDLELIIDNFDHGVREFVNMHVDEAKDLRDILDEYIEMMENKEEEKKNTISSKKKIKLDKTYELDMGSLAPVKVKTKEFTDNGVVCKYLNSVPGREEEIGFDIFEFNGYEP